MCFHSGWLEWKLFLGWKCVPTSRIFIIKSGLETYPGPIGNLHNCDREM